MNFDKIELHRLSNVVKTGSLADLPVEYQEYYSLMDLVRGVRARGMFNNKIINKSGIIKLLKGEPYHLSDYMARKVYEDAISFFYAYENIQPRAFANLYAEKLENAAEIALRSNQLDNYHRLIKEAATLRGCYEPVELEENRAMHRHQFVIYTTEADDLGITGEDLKALEQTLDTLPEIPMLKRERLKSEAGIPGYDFDIVKMLEQDKEEFGETE